MKKNSLCLLFACFFLSSFVFSQTYSTSGISLTKSGNSVTIKWSNSNGGITTKTAVCNGWSGSEAYAMTTCSCSNGYYFILTRLVVNEGSLFGTNSISIKHYDSLNSYQWEVKGLQKQ